MEPVRTCEGCRTTGGKHELIRIVRSPDGSILVDRSGSANGRGAYVHRDGDCLDAALRHRRLASALRTGLGLEEESRLRSEIASKIDGDVAR